MGDPLYKDMAKHFDLEKIPSIVITADSTLSTIENSDKSAFVRIDNELIFSDIDSLKKLLRVLYNLFIRGGIVGAMKEASRSGTIAKLKNLFVKLKDLFTKAVIQIMEKYNIELSFGLFSIKLVKAA